MRYIRCSEKRGIGPDHCSVYLKEGFINKDYLMGNSGEPRVERNRLGNRFTVLVASRVEAIEVRLCKRGGNDEARYRHGNDDQ